MQSKAITVEQYLSELPEDRRAAIQAVRQVILKNLDRTYEERMSYGMIGYAVPHSVYPAGYHCDPKLPLPFAGLASQKNHMAVYLMGLYSNSPGEKSFRDAWEAKTRKKIDMGKCCIRFKKLEDVALEVIGEHIRKTPAKAYIEYYEKARAEHRPGTGVREPRKAGKMAGKKVAKKAGKKKAGRKTVKKVASKRKAARR